MKFKPLENLCFGLQWFLGVSISIVTIPNRHFLLIVAPMSGVSIMTTHKIMIWLAILQLKNKNKFFHRTTALEIQIKKSCMFVVRTVIPTTILGITAGLKINLEMFKLRKMFSMRHTGLVGHFQSITAKNCQLFSCIRWLKSRFYFWDLKRMKKFIHKYVAGIYAGFKSTSISQKCQLG